MQCSKPVKNRKKPFFKICSSRFLDGFERLSAEATFHATAHTAKMKPLLAGYLLHWPFNLRMMSWAMSWLALRISNSRRHAHGPVYINLKFTNWKHFNLIAKLLVDLFQTKMNSNYYHHTWEKDRLPFLKRSFLRAKRQSVGCKWNLQLATWFQVKQSFLMK